MSRRSASVLAALLLGGALAACSTPQNSSQQSSSRTPRLPEIIRDARQYPENRPSHVAACERAIGPDKGDFPYGAFFAGLFDVPEAVGGEVFCAALIEAVVAGDITQQDLDTFKLPKEARGKEPLGALLRALMVARERLYAQQAQRPPQAQSCGCGQ
jgi:hypothetical protein